LLGKGFSGNAGATLDKTALSKHNAVTANLSSEPFTSSICIVRKSFNYWSVVFLIWKAVGFTSPIAHITMVV
jgi:hypothetical protein